MPFLVLRHAICTLNSLKVIFGAFFSVAAYKKKIGDAQTQKRAFGPPMSLFADDPNLLVRPADSLGGRELFFKMMLSVLLVVVLGVAVIYISKKFLPSITNLPGKEIRIIETTQLGPRKAVHLLRIGSRQILIGSTNETITRLGDVTDAFMELSAEEIDNS